MSVDATVTTSAFDPAAWLAKAEGVHGHTVMLRDALGDGVLILSVTYGEGPVRGDEVELWRELRPDREAWDRNREALCRHLETACGFRRSRPGIPIEVGHRVLI